MELTDYDVRIVGRLSVQPIRSTPLNLPEIMNLLDAFVWVEYGLGKIAPKESQQEQEANLRTKRRGDINVTINNPHLTTTKRATGRKV